MDVEFFRLAGQSLCLPVFEDFSLFLKTSFEDLPASSVFEEKLHVTTHTFQNFSLLSCKHYYCSETNLYSRLQAAPCHQVP